MAQFDTSHGSRGVIAIQVWAGGIKNVMARKEMTSNEELLSEAE